ncbi:transmembrane protein 94-like [Hypomesus transpacificus]|uniref:transmembrane protein 94-like n=1 Tax=Hypomesus transpacificus TaxID=137520 RepID=UPI001F07E15B|nr:transmembrane protein 94-like [Hypomesus transpacificus]
MCVCVEVLCCVDKQGVLSWPSPNPDKVLFFSKHTQQACWKEKTTQVEVLSMSRGRGGNSRVVFDDLSWRRHTPSLRPMGLAMMLCGHSTLPVMLRLFDHLTQKARPQHLEAAPPWGVWELPRILGFCPSAQQVFQRRKSVAAYFLPTTPCYTQNLPPRPPLASRLPFPHLIALQVQHTLTGSECVFSYGSAELILAGCSEVWDGEELQPLTDADRKKVLDFYERSCVSGQCLTLSFKPLLDTQHTLHDTYPNEDTHLPPHLDSTCLELPPTHNLDSPELSGQVFLGAVSSVFGVRPVMVRLVSGLDSACIRLVYFSTEQEIKSKVFAEKMGLETGWNCHISLQSERSFPLDTPCPAEKGGGEEEEVCLLDEQRSVGGTGLRLDQEGACLMEDLNRAKLPRGIENVRPHLENIDNVPLLVPLFTDCTPQTVCEMVKVMQDYGEVVCCLGSSQNINNNNVFLQSDISICLEPLLPCCPVDGSPETPKETETPAPMRPPSPPPSSPSLSSLSSALCGLSCSLHLSTTNLTLIQLIRQARHTTAGIRKCFLFLLQCQLYLVLTQNKCVLSTSRLDVVGCSPVHRWSDPSPFFLGDVAMETWLLGGLWLPPLLCINEAIKLHEISLRVRYQKRQKLQFDTKLGMNSPF